MENKNRYVVTLDFYVYADSNEEAIKHANDIAKELDFKYDNKADIISIVKNVFGSMDFEKVDL